MCESGLRTNNDMQSSRLRRLFLCLKSAQCKALPLDLLPINLLMWL